MKNTTMKNTPIKTRLVNLGGTLAFLVVLGNSVATLAPAQVPQPVSVKNVDEKGRAPYMQFQGRGCPGGGNPTCDIVFPPVPAGKRLVVERVSGSILFANGGVRIATLLTPKNVFFFFRVHPTDPKVTNQPVFVVNEGTLAYFESGEAPNFHVVFNDASDTPVVSATVSGYLVDLQE